MKRTSSICIIVCNILFFALSVVFWLQYRISGRMWKANKVENTKCAGYFQCSTWYVHSMEFWTKKHNRHEHKTKCWWMLGSCGPSIFNLCFLRRGSYHQILPPQLADDFYPHGETTAMLSTGHGLLHHQYRCKKTVNIITMWTWQWMWVTLKQQKMSLWIFTRRPSEVVWLQETFRHQNVTGTTKTYKKGCLMSCVMVKLRQFWHSHNYERSYKLWPLTSSWWSRNSKTVGQLLPNLSIQQPIPYAELQHFINPLIFHGTSPAMDKLMVVTTGSTIIDNVVY